MYPHVGCRKILYSSLMNEKTAAKLSIYLYEISKRNV